jgi:hypothetical protein
MQLGRNQMLHASRLIPMQLGQCLVIDGDAAK